jgi:hypothetical protein
VDVETDTLLQETLHSTSFSQLTRGRPKSPSKLSQIRSFSRILPAFDFALCKV